MQRFNKNIPSLKFNRMDESSLLKSETLFHTFPIHSVNVLFPSSNAHKEAFETALASDENVYFLVKGVSAASLIHQSFLKNFVKSGSLLATSHNARVEVENFLSIIHTGQMVLSLERSISKCLSLPKENSNKKKRIKKTFETIVIDIKSPQFSPGRKIYEFAAFELAKIEHIKFTLLIKWTPYGSICPQSLKEYFLQQGIECIACKSSHKSSPEISVIAPTIQYDSKDENVLQDVMEWIGMEICGIKYSNPDEEYVSKLYPPQPSETLNKLYKHTFEGFYSKEDIVSSIKEIRKIFATDPSLPFLVLCLSGFQDSYVSAANFQHFDSADKLICLVAFTSLNYWVISMNASL